MLLMNRLIGKEGGRGEKGGVRAGRTVSKVMNEKRQRKSERRGAAIKERKQ